MMTISKGRSAFEPDVGMDEEWRILAMSWGAMGTCYVADSSQQTSQVDMERDGTQ